MDMMHIILFWHHQIDNIDPDKNFFFHFIHDVTCSASWRCTPYKYRDAFIAE